MPITEITHSKSCEQRLLGFVAEHLPHGATFNLRNLQDGANALRRTNHAPECECTRLQLAQAVEAYRRARKVGYIPALVEQLHQELQDIRVLARAEARRRQERRHAQEIADLEEGEQP
jgi:hypothetical protein